MTSTETTYRVTGMTCGGCARSIQRALQHALPDIEAHISHSEDTVTVRGSHDPARVKQAVSSAGFDFHGPVS